MKHIYLLLALLTYHFAGISGQFTIHPEDFNKLEVLGNYSIKLIKSDSNKLVIDNKDLKVEDEEILAKVYDGTLKIQIQLDNYTKRNISMVLYYKAIDDISARRGAIIEAGSMKMDELSIFVNSGGKVKLDAEVKKVNVSIKSGGSVKIKGLADHANFDVQMGGMIGASFFNVKFVNASVQMGGEIILNALEELNAEVKAGGEISYKGEPKKVNESVKLGGSIEKLETTKDEN